MQWDDRFMRIAKEVSLWSKDPSTKIGAVIIHPPTRLIQSTGYNGFPRGVMDSEARLNDRAVKLMFICHAELNAILNAARCGVKIDGSTLYCCGLPPCTGCAKAIIQSGLHRVVIETFMVPERWKAECDAALQMLREANVIVESMENIRHAEENNVAETWTPPPQGPYTRVIPGQQL
jgi:dCMP deaminase